MKEEKKEEKVIEENIIKTGIGESLEKDFLEYSEYVIKGRAITNVRDGLKPVQRRILYSMGKKGLVSSKPYKKSATVVGDVLGSYHPHGDTSVYEAMVLLAQDFHTRYPLVDGHGNFGSLDGDPAAAYRYTEARLSKVGEAVLSHIDNSYDEKDYCSNFDDSKLEPISINSLVPIALMNGTKGVAVGITANTLPYNATEIYDAVYGVIDRIINKEPKEKDEEIVTNCIKGPDFPTKGIVSGEINKVLLTGEGSITVSGKAAIDKNKNEIIITEMPYKKNKAEMITAISKLPEVVSVSDQSTKDVRVVVKIKKSSNINLALSRIGKKTQFIHRQKILNNYIVDNKLVEKVSVVDMIRYFIVSSEKICVVKIKKELNKKKIRERNAAITIIAKKEIETIVSMLKATNEEYIKLAEEIKKKYKMNDEDMTFIENLKISQLKRSSINDIAAERKRILEEIAVLKSTLSSSKDLLEYTKKEIADTGANILKKDKRLTSVSKEDILSRKSDVESLVDIPLKNNAIILLGNKISSVSSENFSKMFKTQEKGGKGRKSEFDRIFESNTREILYAITSKGKVYKFFNHQIPETGKGTNISNIIKIEENECIKMLIPQKEIIACDSLMSVSEQGMVSRIAKDKIMSRSSCYQLFGVRDGDCIESIKIIDDAIAKDEGAAIVLFNNKGYCPILKINQFSAKGRKSLGYKAAKIVSMAKAAKDARAKAKAAETIDPKDDKALASMAKAVADAKDKVVDTKDIKDIKVVEDKVKEKIISSSIVSSEMISNKNIQILNVLSNGKGKRTPLSEFPEPTINRNVKGSAFAKLTKKENVIFAGLVDISDKNEVLSVTACGRMVSIKTSGIQQTKTRASKGSAIIKFSGDPNELHACILSLDEDKEEEKETNTATTEKKVAVPEPRMVVTEEETTVEANIAEEVETKNEEE